MKVAPLLGLWGPWQRQVCRNTHCLCRRSYGPIRVFYQTSCSWQSEGLFGQSFSVALPVQAFRGHPCLPGVLLYCSECQAHRRAPWLGSYSIDEHISHLKEHPGWGSRLYISISGIEWASISTVQLPMLACGERGATVMAPPPMRDPVVSPCFHGCLAFLHRHFPPQSPPSHPWICRSTVNSNPSPGIAP